MWPVDRGSARHDPILDKHSVYFSPFQRLVGLSCGGYQRGLPEPLSKVTRILGERIRIPRVKLAWSQEEIAHLAGMNVSNFGTIECGLGNPNFHTRERIASVLGIDPAVLVAKIGANALPDLAETFTAADFVRKRRRREHNG